MRTTLLALFAILTAAARAELSASASDVAYGSKVTLTQAVQFENLDSARSILFRAVESDSWAAVDLKDWRKLTPGALTNLNLEVDTSKIQNVTKLIDSVALDVEMEWTFFNSSFDALENVDMSGTDGTVGSSIDGASSDEEGLGKAIRVVPDINFDGVDDLIISSNQRFYVIFGKKGAWDLQIDVESLDGGGGTKGFAIEKVGTETSFALDMAHGDWNCDGITDYAFTGGADNRGGVFVLFGGRHVLNFPASLKPFDSATFTFNSTTGFKLRGGDEQPWGASVVNLGKFRRLDCDTLFMGSPSAYSSALVGLQGGAAIVYYGNETIPALVDVEADDIDGENGFEMRGESIYDFMGQAAAGECSLSGSAYDDFCVGANGWDNAGGAANDGRIWCLFGGPSGANANNAASFDPETLDGSDGFVIVGRANPYFVMGLKHSMRMGDFDADGKCDLAVTCSGAPRLSGANTGAAGGGFVLWGRDTWLGQYDSEDLDGTQTGNSQTLGLTFQSYAFSQYLGECVSFGDANGDGIQDLFVAGRGRAQNTADGYGRGYLFFGKRDRSGYPDNMDLLTYDTDVVAFRDILHQSTAGYGALWGYACDMGDINGDGVDDIVVGSVWSNGWKVPLTQSISGHKGRVEIIFGRSEVPDVEAAPVSFPVQVAYRSVLLSPSDGSSVEVTVTSTDDGFSEIATGTVSLITAGGAAIAWTADAKCEIDFDAGTCEWFSFGATSSGSFPAVAAVSTAFDFQINRTRIARGVLPGVEPQFLKVGVELTVTFPDTGQVATRVAEVKVFPYGACPKGTFSTSGSTVDGACFPCLPGTFADVPGSTSCSKCPLTLPATVSAGSTSADECTSEIGFLVSRNPLTGERAQVPCPEGADCATRGATLSSLPLRSGFWRASAESLAVLECLNDNYCSSSSKRRLSEEASGGDWNASQAIYCASAHVGPLCEACLPNYAIVDSNVGCELCSDSVVKKQASLVALGGAMIFLMAFLISGAYAYYSHRIVESPSSQTASTKKIDTFLARGGVPDFVTFKMRIIITLLQVASIYFGVFATTLPRVFAPIANAFEVFLFDLGAFFNDGVTCLSEAITEHYVNLLVSTLSPVVVMAGVWSGVLLVGRIVTNASNAAKSAGVRLTLLYLFLIYPSVSNVVFSTFQCRSFDAPGMSALQTDLTTSCTSEKRTLWVLYALVNVVVYPLGVIGLFGGLVYRNKEAFRVRASTSNGGVPNHLSHLSFLFSAYDPNLYYFECVALLIKLMQTSVLVVFFEPGSVSQMLATTLGQFFAAVAYVGFKPFKSTSDNVLMYAVQGALLGIAFLTTQIRPLGEEKNDLEGVERRSFAAILSFLLAPFTVLLLQLLSEYALKRRSSSKTTLAV